MKFSSSKFLIHIVVAVAGLEGEEKREGKLIVQSCLSLDVHIGFWKKKFARKIVCLSIKTLVNITSLISMLYERLCRTHRSRRGKGQITFNCGSNCSHPSVLSRRTVTRHDTTTQIRTTPTHDKKSERQK